MGLNLGKSGIVDFRKAKSNTEKVVFIYFTIVAYSIFSGIERAYRPRIYNPNYYFSDF